MFRRRLALAGVLLVSAPRFAAATLIAPPPAPPLPPPTGNVVTVATVAALETAVANLVSGTTILIQPGTYKLTWTLRIRNGVTDVGLRGATGNRDDVVILGDGMAVPGIPHGITCEDAQDVLIANLSVGEVQYHPIQLQGEQGCDRVRLYNVRLFDAGEQFVKGTVDFANPDGVDDGIVEYSVIEYTTIGPDHGYTNGVDIHHGDNWIIRYNLFRNIRVPAGAPQWLGPAVLMWSGSRFTQTYANTFIDCERAIAYGLGPQPGFPFSHEGGLICGNFIHRQAAVPGDSAISLWESPGTRVLHNTSIQSGTYPDAIEYRFPGTTGAVIKNNLADGAVKQRDDAQAEVESNVTTATAGLFVDTTRSDLHLVPGAAVAIDQGVPLADCGLDWDGQPRPYGPARDIGADEYVPAALPALSIGDAAAVEGNTGSVDATFEVSLSQPSSSTVTVAFAAVPGTATAGNDYLPASGTLTFAPGVTEQAVAVAVLGDTLVEPDETFGVDLSSPVGATVEVGTGTGTIVDDDAAPLAGYEVGHGSHQWADLAQGEAVFKVAQQPRASYEVTVDAASGDTTPLVFERLAADNLTILQTAAPVGTGSAVTLRWRNATALTVTNQHLRLRGACSPSCGPDDVYRLRAWETTLSGPRYNNSGGQVTVLLLANGGTATVEGRAYFWSASGTLLASHPFMLGPRQSFSLNTASLPPLAGQSGSVTVAHTGGHDALIGKTVALEPTTGFSFDTPLVARAVR
jgi:hypothetical protein